MDVKRNVMPGQNSSENPESRLRNLPYLFEPYGYGLTNWRNDPNLRRTMKQRIAQFLSENTSCEIDLRTILVPRLEDDVFRMASSLEDYVSQKMLNGRLQYLLQRNYRMVVNHGKKVARTLPVLPLSSGMRAAISRQSGGCLSSDAASSQLHNRLYGNSSCIQSPQIDEPVHELDCKDKQQSELKRTSNGFHKFSKSEDSAEANSKKPDEDLLSCPKRMRTENSCLVASPKNHTCLSTSPPPINTEAMEEQLRESFPKATQYSMSLGEIRNSDARDIIKSETVAATVTAPYEELVASHEPMDIEPSTGSNTGDHVKEISGSLLSKCTFVSPKDEAAEVQVRTESIQTQPGLEADPDTQTNPGSLRIKGLSNITEFFTIDQLKEHISSLRPLDDQDFMNSIEEKDQSVCQLCRLNRILLAPEPMYCSLCFAPIKQKGYYYQYTPKEDSEPYCCCTACYKLLRGGRNISICGIEFPKEALNRKRNDSQILESWVQCDTCDGWQHQICGLYNEQSDSERKSKYSCPICSLKGKENGDHKPLNNSAVFSAKHLPHTKLSNHIEERLFQRLRQERNERARAIGKCFDEVPGAEDLTVRVVLSTKKQLTVKKGLLETLEDESYPAQFPYTSKLVLLFQKIGGVDVCLFSMYVQEFGSDCAPPNKRCVYISYIDSIKYFRPSIGTSTGEALRTFAFHEILIGYLDFVKKRGFATCYIWACPPLKGDDFFFNCHPETQKIPKSDKLRKWYKTMLRKASNEEIVVNYTNLYDRFFIPTRESNCKITAARLPYFDGDYWSGAIEDVVKNIERENKENPTNRINKGMTKRAIKAIGDTNSSGAVDKDILLMQKLGQSILPYKKDFMVIDLQYVCTHCSEPILSGKRWFCDLCKKFQICESCHDVEHYSNETHTSAKGEKHFLSQVLMDMPLDTKDEDVELNSELFDNRNKFLSFCRDNCYQFDSLRRAKHSSMLILYNLLHLVVPTVKTSSSHSHKLTQQSVSHEVKSKRELPERLRIELLRLLLHANHCRPTKANPCFYKHCFEIRMMFRHAKLCKVRANGGCRTCEKVWYALNLHATSCEEEDCQMPRCKDLKGLAASRC